MSCRGSTLAQRVEQIQQLHATESPMERRKPMLVHHQIILPVHF